MKMNRSRYADGGRPAMSLDEAVSREIKMLIAGTRGMSTSALADALGMRRPTLSTRVNAHSTFNLEELSAVAEQLGTTAAVIVARAEQALADMQSAEPARPVAETPAPSRQATTDSLAPSARSARAHRIPTRS